MAFFAVKETKLETWLRNRNHTVPVCLLEFSNNYSNKIVSFSKVVGLQSVEGHYHKATISLS